MLSITTNFGAQVLRRTESLGLKGIFFAVAVAQIVRPPFNFTAVLRQIQFVGARSTLVISVAGAFVGMVVALQFYDTLVRFGSVSLLGSAVGLSLVRELGPVLTALIVIGRAGSAMCAEMGIMRSDNQIDALHCMAIDPMKFLIAPRFIAFIFSVPLLTALFNVIGIFGGWFVAVVMFEIGQGAYFQSMADSVTWHDVAMGLIKSFFFALIIVWICLAKGYLMHKDSNALFGAAGISRVTTDAVVYSSIAVLFTDYIISAIML